MSILVADLETNGLFPDVIWMVGILDVETDEFTAYVEDEVPAGILRMHEADVLIGHNIRKYDCFHIERLMEGIVTFDQRRIVDTVELSRKLFPSLKDHKLATWGEILGSPKLDFKEFDRYTPEMAVYCEQDCRLNKALYEFLLSQIDGRKLCG